MNEKQFWVVVICYFIPMIICFINYGIDIIKSYRSDIIKRKTAGFYVPFLTKGDIILSILLSIIPVVNIFVFFIDIFYPLIEYLINKFDGPLVPDSEEWKGIREEGGEKKKKILDKFKDLYYSEDK